MKIALVRQRYNPYGGAERFVERAMTALAARDVELTLLARDWSTTTGSTTTGSTTTESATTGTETTAPDAGWPSLR